MPKTKKLKASDRQAISRKVMAVLKKRYGGSLPRDSHPVLETLLFAACLENSDYESVQRVFAHMLESFHDLNEIRVSSITEIERVLTDLADPEWKALRIRETLQHTFEKHYSFDLDALKRKTMDAADKQLSEIRYLTPFMRTYVLQNCLGSHVVQIDDASLDVLVWLGLVDAGATQEGASEDMKAALKKQDKKDEEGGNNQSREKKYSRDIARSLSADGIQQAIVSENSVSWRLLDFFSNHFSRYSLVSNRMI